MIRLHVLGEGHTEKRFVEGIITNHLIKYDIVVDVCLFLTKFTQKTGQRFKGGVASYSQVRKDISSRLRDDKNSDSRFTTMIDFYGLPKDFPGLEQTKSIDDPYEKCSVIETSFAHDINDERFIPYIQMHEFEALIFADPIKLEYEYIDNKRQIQDLVLLSKEIPAEMINDGFNTSPSHRIINAIPAYNKLYAGSRITELIGLNTLRHKCPHFDGWLTKLEGLSS